MQGHVLLTKLDTVHIDNYSSAYLKHLFVCTQVDIGQSGQEHCEGQQALRVVRVGDCVV